MTSREYSQMNSRFVHFWKNEGASIRLTLAGVECASAPGYRSRAAPTSHVRPLLTLQ